MKQIISNTAGHGTSGTILGFIVDNSYTGKEIDRNKGMIGNKL